MKRSEVAVGQVRPLLVRRGRRPTNEGVSDHVLELKLSNKLSNAANVTHCGRATTICRPPRRHQVPHAGARAGSRTLNLGIKSPLLCQLSYASVT